MGILKKIWDMLPEGRPICVPKPEAWGVKQEEDKERDKDLKKERWGGKSKEIKLIVKLSFNINWLFSENNGRGCI